MERSGSRWYECFEKHMQSLITLLRVLQDMKEPKFWMIKSLLIVVKATKRIFLMCEMNVSNSSVAGKLKNSLFNTLQRFKTAKPLD